MGTIQQRAFTLVELSIVLVILGLLIGGVLTGQSLIRAAELRSVSTQHARYTTAVQTFRDKYFGLPGDMTNATAYWGLVDAAGGTCRATASTSAITCNGNGDGMIEVSAASNERFRFWQHLANAGLIEGTFTGISSNGVGSGNAVDTTNSPAGKISSSVWYSNYVGSTGGGTDFFAGDYGNALLFGKVTPGNLPWDPILKPEEAYNIDMKIDDGMPANGKVVMRATTMSSCTSTSSSTALDATYRLSNSGLACALYFRNVY